MFSLKTTELKGSRIGLALWLVTAIAYAALLRLYWVPVDWQALFYALACASGVWLVWFVRRTSRRIGIDDQGAFLFERGAYKRLVFIRANDFQLIARVDQGDRFWAQCWPVFRVIYRDSVDANQYQILRSFAAQQIVLRRSERPKKTR
ncbi:hypothetical protein HGG82_15170 [Marinomonas sp. M1K-6]|uniref:Toxin CptA n=1 Tax=Marinomonas profundi TaxID=2726122 RepID=A0A847RCC1_9GAMM|nr:hypothetical protein [Marinomonas profundi]NLQ18947.1 hypothetical protein [Marinomonas profundi]UDV02314.1 hypothetical protein J8N69_12005 [Marinomonas profundi]